MNRLGTKYAQSLVKLGLSQNEARVYQILVEEGQHNAKEIANKINILPNAVYRLLQKLITKDLVIEKEAWPKVFTSVSPSVALESLAKKKTIEIESLKEKAIKNLIIKSRTPPQTHISFMKNKKASFEVAVKMFNKAKKEVLIISIGEPIPQDALLSVRRAYDRGVIVRMIAQKYDNENTEILKNFIKNGCQIRHFPDRGFHLLIRDSQDLMLSINNPNDTDERVGMQIFSHGLCKAMRDYFYSVWEKAVKIS